MKIVSYSGGGMRGLLGLAVTEYIESITGKHMAQLVDGFAGTSTGSITALGLAKPNPLWAHELVSLYLDNAERIFPKPWWSRLQSVWGLKSDLYPVSGLESLLKQAFKATTMTSLAKPVVITAVDATTKQPITLTEQTRGWLVWEAARASSAGPSFFAPFELLGHAYCDGGLYANVPDLVACDRWHLEGQRHCMLSLGTGQQLGGWAPAELRELGEVRWASKVIEMAIDLVSQQTVTEAADLFAPGDYLRIDPVLPADLAAMDQSDPKKLAALYSLGKAEVARRRAELDLFITKLVK